MHIDADKQLLLTERWDDFGGGTV